MKKITDINNICEVNTPSSSSSFVGIKADKDSVRVFFPIGYQLPKKSAAIYTDINNLCAILSAFNDGRIRSGSEIHIRKSTLDFPFKSYQKVIRNHINNQWPSICKYDPVLDRITQFCVWEAFQKIGWLYTIQEPKYAAPYEVGICAYTLKNALSKTPDIPEKRQDREFISAMLAIILYLEKHGSKESFSFGTEHFDLLWRGLIHRMFSDPINYPIFPNTQWKFNHRSLVQHQSPHHATIMVYDGKHYLIDGSYCGYGCNGELDQLPNTSDHCKQITYGEWVAQNNSSVNSNTFNCFVMPFNQEKNPFNIQDLMANVGEATMMSSSSTYNNPFERIQGIVVDIRYVMFHYTSNSNENKKFLADCVENAFYTTTSKTP